mmetsp:Transcript_32307/g.45062  ORF Transcript_32307/g.45062 Transcript_32307/m.45062 type:complete len:294 (-) Transcript_32307:272-1153(-)|eukprot:CAMPEP_0185267652 /NCGR_PEP_ID=MMETSP1359-20130426/34923_1 /TAXON_ID=552665 /ORGANISM="Bigelowiella longifila, Strain CCMP242" /LENGTH=293 /DNA_ID=CAMNT_0027858073 /DNA_START=49 /DNA_END=930 /DNA_ORIENTATION=-
MSAGSIAKNLAGRVAIVTGGGNGIGKAVAKRLHQSGARVAVCDISRSNGMKVVDEIKGDGGTAAFVHTDVTRHASIKAMVEEVGTRFGRIDVLVNNAATFIFGHLGIEGHGSGTGTDRNISSDDWNRILQTNIVGYSRCIESVVPWMRRNALTDVNYDNDQGMGITKINAGSRGAIVNVCSISSFIAQPEFVPYNVTKAGILVMTKCTAMDLAGYKIRVNAISPGTVETAGSYNHMNLIGLDIEEGKRMFATATLLQRQAAPEEVANGIAFLASDESSYMTGANIVMDGGQTI